MKVKVDPNLPVDPNANKVKKIYKTNFIQMNKRMFSNP